MRWAKSGEPDKFTFREGLKFNQSYWYVVALCFTFYSGIFPFRTFAIDLFTSKILAGMGAAAGTTAAFASAQQQAGSLNSLLPFSAMIATPTVRIAGGQDWQASDLDDVWVVSC